VPSDETGLTIFTRDIVCPPKIAKKLGGSEEVGVVEGGIIWALTGIMTIQASVGNWVLALAGKFLTAILGAERFVRNGFVTSGWPFVQGIANLGFILALLYIAALTTLQLNVGGGIRRVLPRLLLAALLINFSLVIGGLLIDASRLVMAALIRVIGGGNLSSIASSVVLNSDIVTKIFTTASLKNDIFLNNKIDTTRSWAILLSVVQATIFIWGLAIAMMVMAITLIVRYIALILLLIFSPLAYLSIALPGASGFASMWWKNFLKWVLYGPAAVFMLALLVAVQSPAGDVLQKQGDTLTATLNVVITIAMLIAATRVGTYVAGAGAGAAAGLVTNRVKGAARAGGRGAKFLGRSAAQSLDRRSGFKDLREGFGKAREKRSQQSPIRRGAKKLGERIGRSRTVAGTTGAGTGAGTGAAMGAALGSVVPVVGTAVGAVTGAAAGALAGGLGGSRRTQQEKDTIKTTDAAQETIKGSMVRRNDISAESSVSPTALRNVDIGKLSIDEIRHVVAEDKTSRAQKEALLQRPEVVEKILKEDDSLVNEILVLETNAEDDRPTNPTDPGFTPTNRDDNREAKQSNADNKSIIRALNKGLEAHDRKKKDEIAGK